jgi:hypothetical protein
MRKILCGYAFLLAASSASAQEVYSLTASAGQVAQHDRDRAARNRQTCQQLALAVTCTQAQACTAASAPGGSGCSAAQARGAGVRIYPATLAGREEFLTFDIVAPEFQRRVAAASADEKKAVCSWFVAQNTATQNAECAKWGLLDGCNPCQ